MDPNLGNYLLSTNGGSQTSLGSVLGLFVFSILGGLGYLNQVPTLS